MKINNRTIQEFCAHHLTMPVIYVVPDPNWALGLEDLLPNYHIVCYDRSWSVDYLEAQGVSLFCWEEEGGDPEVKRSASGLLREKRVQDFITSVAGDAQPHILVFKTSPAVEIACAQLGYRLLAAPSELNRRFEDKACLYSVLDRLPEARIPGMVGRMGEFDYAIVAKTLGERSVVQFARGFAGSSTVFLQAADDFFSFQKEYSDRFVKLSRFIDGTSLTINGCVTSSGSAISPYFYQIIGQAAYNAYPGGTSGNDYAYDFGFSASVDAAIYDLTDRFGSLLQDNGYRGIFGLDLVVERDSGQVYIIECNARLVASIPVYTKLQLIADEIPLLLLHICALLDIQCDLDLHAYNLQIR
ncbi:MAG TPA: ATP-grasp domain-containing protein, partial [bacterium]|nr:ATP-grasp domain-containing protein [bacterium]